MKFIKDLKEVGRKDIALAGGKGANLGELLKIEMPVPEGFVITVAAYQEFLKQSRIRSKVREKAEKLDIEAVGPISHELQKAVLEGKIRPSLRREILTGFDRLRTRYVAVRSSATAEDNSRTSWAGQLSSFLNVTRLNLVDAVKGCWASLFTPRALCYRDHCKVREVAVAVVVQRMVEAEVSGIVFTAHPVTKDRGTLLIEVGWGLGEAIVQGLTIPDSFVIDKKSLNIRDCSLGRQKRMIVPRRGGGVETTDIPKEKQGRRKLSEEKAKELTRLCIEIEDHYRHPQDIEWSIDKTGKIWILQSRPITTL